MKKIEKMKTAILQDWSWCGQNGPGDRLGYEQDNAVRECVGRAETWVALLYSVEEMAYPSQWTQRVIDAIPPGTYYMPNMKNKIRLLMETL
jgi:hypothetical protein